MRFLLYFFFYLFIFSCFAGENLLRGHYKINDCKWENTQAVKFKEKNQLKIISHITEEKLDNKELLEVLFFDEKEKLVYKTYSINPYQKLPSSITDYYVCNRGSFFDVPKSIVDRSAYVQLLERGGRSVKIVFRLLNYEIMKNNLDEVKLETLYEGDSNDGHFTFLVVPDGFSAKTLSHDENLFRKKAIEISNYLISKPPFSAIKNKIRFIMASIPSPQDKLNNGKNGIDSYFGTLAHYNKNFRALPILKSENLYEIQHEFNADQTIILANTEKGGYSSDYVSVSIHSPKLYRTVYHEVSHSLGRIGDNYHYYFDVSGDEKYSIEELQKYFYRNTSTEDSFEKSPWKHFLTPSSPVVYFDSPIERPKLIEDDNKIVFQFISSFNSSDLRIIGDIAQDRYYNLITYSEGISVYKNGKLLSVKLKEKLLDMPKMLSGKVEKNLMLLGSKINLKIGDKLKLVFKLKQSARGYIGYFRSILYNTFLVQLVSRDFNPVEVGIYEGSKLGKKGVFRSSFVSSMNNLKYPLDPYESSLVVDTILQKK